MKLIEKKDNCPVPRGGRFTEKRTYELEDGSLKTKTIKIAYFTGRYADWESYVEKQPFDE